LWQLANRSAANTRELLGHVRLVDEVIHAPVKGAGQRLHTLLGSQKDHIGVVVVLLVLLTYRIRQLQPVHVRHQPVGNQHTDRALLQALQGLRRGIDHAHIAIAGLLERATDNSTAEAGIINNKNGEFWIHWGSVCCETHGGPVRAKSPTAV